MLSELDKVKSLLIERHGARAFVEKAMKMGFTVVGEDHMGLTMQGKNSRFIITVLASRGRDKIFTLSFKQDNLPVVTLVDEGRINFTYHPKLSDEKTRSLKAALKERRRKREIENNFKDSDSGKGCLLSFLMLMASSIILMLLT